MVRLMRVKLKLQLFIIPLIILPVLATAYIFIDNTSSSIRGLYADSLHRNLEIIMNHLEQENSVIERLGAANTRFYEKNAQSHARNFILDLSLENGVIQIFDKNTLEVVNETEVFNRDFYMDLSDDILEQRAEGMAIEKTVASGGKEYVVFYQYFEPWDWLVLVYMDENIIYQPINHAISQMLFIVAGLVVMIGLFLYVVTSRLTAPIDSLMKGVKSISDGHYMNKVDINTNDEFKDLADAFNTMTGRIQQSFDSLNDMTEELKIVNVELESRVEERTRELKETNDELELSIIQMRALQDDLVESRKIAALGSLVAGISHELNTPIGIGITTASYISMQTDSLLDLYHSGKLKKADFVSELESIKHSAELILDNLGNASSMVNSFKLLAVDQSREHKKEFELIHSIEGLLQNMNVLLRKGKHTVSLDYEKPIEMYSYPGVITQVLTHFIMNSVEHGFQDKQEGRIKIYVKQEGSRVTLVYEDDGLGMDENKVHRIFEPFFTSKLGKGSSGLGLNIVYNLVTGILKGKLSAMSRMNEGMRITMIFPTIVKDE